MSHSRQGLPGRRSSSTPANRIDALIDMIIGAIAAAPTLTLIVDLYMMLVDVQIHGKFCFDPVDFASSFGDSVESTDPTTSM